MKTNLSLYLELYLNISTPTIIMQRFCPKEKKNHHAKKTKMKFFMNAVIHFLLPLVLAPPGQTPAPLLLSHSELILSTFAVEDGKKAGDLYPVSAYKFHMMNN